MLSMVSNTLYAPFTHEKNDEEKGGRTLIGLWDNDDER